MAGNGNKGGEPATQARPNCQICEAEGRCRFRRVVQTIIAKAEILVGLGREGNAEDLIAAAFALCDEVHH